MLRFGTDGVRGVARHEITPEALQYFARAAARALRCSGVVVGYDPRESSLELAGAVAEGFRIEGVNVEFAGMAPTPALAYLAQRSGSAAAVVTASHNPHSDNGLKLFRAGGTKLSDVEENLIQSIYEDLATGSTAFVAPGEYSATNQLDSYVAHIVALGAGVRSGLRVVVDCANGAMSSVAPRVLEHLGVDARVYNATPDGTNINVECGAAHPNALASLVRTSECDLGIAFDGDGDRLIAATSDGVIVDGDHLIALAALDMKARHLLTNNAVVVTVMTNMGFHRSMRDAGITVYSTPVGDRSVLVEMERTGAVLGGEQSGHIIHRSVATTGDGLLAAVQLFATLGRTGLSLADAAASAMTSFPQVLINVRVSGDAKAIAAACGRLIQEAEDELGDTGRVLVRPSGTEPLLRVMVEATHHEVARRIAEQIADFARNARG